MNAQNRTPSPASNTVRTSLPRSPERARERAVSHLGPSRCRRAGFGSVAGAPAVPVFAAASGIQDRDELASGIVTGEAQEDLLQSATVVVAAGPKLGNRARGDDLSALNDADAVAQCLRDFERVRGHHDGVAARRVLAEQVLEDA